MNRGDNTWIGSAAAQVAAHALANLCVGKLHRTGLAQVGGYETGRALLRFVEKRHCGDNLTRSAISALISIVVEECLLHRVQDFAFSQAFNGRHSTRRRVRPRAPGSY